jgi:Glycosyltransferase 61
MVILLFAILFSMEENYRRTDLLVAPFRNQTSTTILADKKKPMTTQQQQEMKATATATAECQAQAKTPHHDLLPIRNAHKILLSDDGVVVKNQGGDTTTTRRQQHWPVSYYLRPIIAANNNNNNNNNSSATTMTTTAGEENATSAVCAVIENHLLQHFPHAAQQLFRCWSYWRQRSDVPSVLYWKADAQLRNASDYVSTLLDVWQREIGLTIVDGNATEITEWDVGALATPRKTDQYPFALAAPDDARAFRALMAPRATDWNCHTTTIPPPPPRIAILNRQINRSLVNVQALVGALEQAFGTSNTTVPVVYFEDTTFQDQMDFMANTDIVISPHGAQLTSIIAMPECGGLLEIYPPQYYPVNFFGSLADASAILHQTLYLDPSGNNNTVSAVTVDVPYAAVDYHSRVLARSARLCPNVDAVVQLTRRLVAARTQCCNIKNNDSNNANNSNANNNANSPSIV